METATETEATPPAREEADWAFLQPWFQRLIGRVSDHTPDRERDDAIRVGCDSDADLWLELRYYREIRRNSSVPHFPFRLLLPTPQLREAIILTSLLAKAHYSLWLTWMRQIARASLPPNFVKDHPTWKVQYRVALNGVRDPGTMEYFKVLFGDAEYSESFVQDLNTAKELLTSQGFDWKTLEPVEVMVCCNVNNGYNLQDGKLTFQTSIECLRNVAEILTFNRAIHEASTDHFASVLKVAALYLDTDMATLDGRLMDALRVCVSTGVRVEFLSLPMLGSTTLLDVGDVANFWRTLLGLVPDAHDRYAEVVHLRMPSWYARSHLWAPFCSALAVSRTLRVLHLQIQSRESGNPFGSFAVRRRRAWMWLAFALFSSASSTSVETLVLDNQEFNASDAEAVRQMITTQDPVALLCHLSREPTAIDEPASYTRQHAYISEDDILETVDARLSRQYFRLNDGNRANMSFVGAIVRQCAFHGHVQAFIPGLGVCWVKEHDEKRPQKRQRVQIQRSRGLSHGQSSFRALAYTQVPLNKTKPIHFLLGVIGPRVRSLGLWANQDPLDQIFSACPNLESLRVQRARIESMEGFNRAYEIYRLPLSSLYLRTVAVVEESLQRFLQSLLREGKTEETLQRLSLGEKWFHGPSPATFTTLARILDENKTLTHLDYYFDGEDDIDPGLQERYNGQIVQGISTDGRRQRLAILGRLDRLLDRYLHLQVDDHVKQLIFQYAVPMPITRKVVGRPNAVGRMLARRR